MREDTGQVTIMALGLAMMSLAIAGLAVDGTRAFLLRRTLQNAADSSALAAAGELSRRDLYISGGEDVLLDRTIAARRARNHLSSRGVDAQVSLEIANEEVRLVLRSVSDTLFLSLVGIARVPVAVESRASPIPGGLP